MSVFNFTILLSYRALHVFLVLKFSMSLPSVNPMPLGKAEALVDDC